MGFFVCTPKAFKGLYSSHSAYGLKSLHSGGPISVLAPLSLAYGSGLHDLILNEPQFYTIGK